MSEARDAAIAATKDWEDDNVIPLTVGELIQQLQYLPHSYPVVTSDGDAILSANEEVGRVYLSV